MALCRIHQRNPNKDVKKVPTVYARRLYDALRKKNIPCELEKKVPYKTRFGIKYMHVDIAVVEAKVNIEIDGAQHNYDPRQALADLKRTFHAFRRGFLTLRIPNTLIEKDLEATADYVAEFLLESMDQLDAEEFEEWR